MGTNNRMQSNRDNVIDVLKLIAVLLITWSHFDVPLGKYGALATGGAFGDSLFFFISGYTLLLSNRETNFVNWYKRRINRIYPTVFAWALVVAVLFGDSCNMKDILLHGGGFFVSCIMIFYLFFYPIKRYVPISYYKWVLVVCFILQAVCFFLIDQASKSTLYRWQWSGFFLSMLARAMAGYQRKNRTKTPLTNLNIWIIVVCFFATITLYYVLMYYERGMKTLATLNIIPLVFFAYLLFELCCRVVPKQLCEKRKTYWIVRFLGGLCLEVYIVQPRIITDKLNSIFPFNLVVIFVAIIIAAYLLRCLGRLWSQTFKEDDYNWREIVSPY